MTRQEIAANGITSVFCLLVRGETQWEYLCPPNPLGDLTSPQEERAEVWVREIDALEMKRRAEHLAGLKLEIVRRPTLIGGADPYCSRCGHIGSHNPFCGSLRAWVPEEIGDREWYGLLLPQVSIEWGGCSKCGAQISRRIQFINGGLCEACQPLLIDAEHVRQGEEELEISVTELAAGMATADFREEREEAARG